MVQALGYFRLCRAELSSCASFCMPEAVGANQLLSKLQLGQRCEDLRFFLF